MHWHQLDHVFDPDLTTSFDSMGQHSKELNVNVWHVNCRVVVVETNIVGVAFA